MMNRTQWALTIILIINLMLLGMCMVGGNRNEGADPRLFLPEMPELEISRIEISSPDKGPLTLSHGENGWNLPAQGGFPADTGKVIDLINDLRSMTVRRPVVSSSEYHDSLEVTADNHRCAVKLWDGHHDDPLVEFYLGSSPSYRVYHIRKTDDESVYEQDLLSPYELEPDPASWVKKRIVDLQPGSNVSSLDLRNGNGRIRLERNDDLWRIVPPTDSPPGEPDQEAINSFVQAVTGINMKEPAGRLDMQKHGFDRPVAEMEVGWGPEEGKIRILLGGEVPGQDGSRYGAVDGSGFSFILSSWEAEKLTSRKSSDLGSGN